VSGQVDDWQDVDEAREELVMGKLDTERNEPDCAKLLIKILEELVNREFVPEGNELEIVELLIRILDELLARVLDAKEREIEAEARLNEDNGAAADEKVELDANTRGNNDDIADADELEPGAERRDEDARTPEEEAERSIGNDDDAVKALL
jgi:hypothetical protein